MTGPVTYKMEGLREAQAALLGLSKATSRNVGRKALRAGAEPILAEFKARAARLTGEMVDTSGISTRLSRRQRAQHRRQVGDDVEMFVGAGSNPQAVQQEFGNINHPAQPALIPAFENNKRNSLDLIGKSLWTEIRKSVERVARKHKKNIGGK